MTDNSEFIILVVEDSVGGRNLAHRMLTSLGYQVILARNALDALDLIEHGQPFDVLFTDILMPGDMDGVELARLVRSRDATMKILFTSGFSALTNEEIAELGATYVGKPYRRVEIADILRIMLRPPD